MDEARRRTQNVSNIKGSLHKYATKNLFPKEWDRKNLEDLCIEKGLVRGPFGGTLKKECFVNTGYKVYEQKNAIYKDVNIGDYFINDEKYQELQRFAVNDGNFIVSCSGTIGKIFRIPKGALRGIINQALLNIKLDEDIIESEFFYHYFQWDSFQRKIIDNTQGGAMQNLVGMNIFRKTKLAVPLREEQQKIATILSTWDKAIELKEKLIEQKKEQKRGLMQKLLTGEVRLPGFEGEWKEVLLRDIFCRFSTGLNPRNNFKLNSGGLIYYVTIKNFHDGMIYLDERCDLVDENAFILINNRADLRKDDILLASIGRVGDVCLIKEDPKNWNINESVFSLRPNKKMIFPAFAYYILSHDRTKSILEMKTTGSTFKSIKMTDLKKINCNIPSDLNEQKSIAEVLLLADKQINLLQQELQALKLQKKGLMQLLLTGIVRVNTETN